MLTFVPGFTPSQRVTLAFPVLNPETGMAGLVSRSPIPIGGVKLAHPHSFVNATDEDVKRIESGRWWLYVYAIVWYEGVSGKKYFTEYHARYNPKRKLFEECGTHNDAN